MEIVGDTLVLIVSYFQPGLQDSEQPQDELLVFDWHKGKLKVVSTPPSLSAQRRRGGQPCNTIISDYLSIKVDSNINYSAHPPRIGLGLGSFP